MGCAGTQVPQQSEALLLGSRPDRKQTARKTEHLAPAPACPMDQLKLTEERASPESPIMHLRGLQRRGTGNAHLLPWESRQQSLVKTKHVPASQASQPRTQGSPQPLGNFSLDSPKSTRCQLCSSRALGALRPPLALLPWLLLSPELL